MTVGSSPDPREVLDAGWQSRAFSAGQYLRVVNWHNTPRTQRHLLRAELAWYAERYDPVRPADLDRFFDTGEWGLRRPGFIPAFYDNYRNHVDVAVPVCDELGLPAWFFPLTGALDVPADAQREYAERHFVELLPEEPEPPWLLDWDALAAIAASSTGHVVAAHTAHHASAASIVTLEDVEREIATPVRQLTEVTGLTPPGFAFLYGTPPEPGTLAGDAVLASGVRYAVTNTAYIRIAD